MYKLDFPTSSVELNEQQYKVATSPAYENQRILASAGSGKTSTITARIAYLVHTYEIDINRILLISFSRSAAQEVIKRVDNLIGVIPQYAGTFHALSHQILTEQSPKSLKDSPFIDELPYRLSEWLDTASGKKWIQRFRIIIVDEFQDINEIQWQILNRFKHPWSSMTIVGDDAQNIYTWRGSSVDYILNFHKHIKYVADYQLCKNYRSTEAIVTVANAVMRFIPTLSFKEKMIANIRGGNKPEVHFFFKATDEYDWVVSMIEQARKQNPNYTCAVISRYNMDLFRMEDRLHLKGIPYRLCASIHDTDTDNKHDPHYQAGDRSIITLATIHSSKGLEWDIVFFINLNDTVFPSRKSDEEIVCERRLFYVGITRAKQYLYLSYSRHEKSLSRFVREIPRPFLQYYNVASLKMSDFEPGDAVMSVDDMIHGFDGEDWSILRNARVVPDSKVSTVTNIYKFAELFNVPAWVKQHDVREVWFEMMRFVTLRECIRYTSCTIEDGIGHASLRSRFICELQTPEIIETLLTIRIYKEDIEFWEQYEIEMKQIVHHFLKHTYQMKAVEYHELEEYVATCGTLSHILWTPLEMSKAMLILIKIRGQLRPLRHKGFDLKEFSFGVVRNSVPTELRPEVLESWHRVINPQHKTSDILSDIWNIASLKYVLKGRNIPLYQLRSISGYLKEQIQMEIVGAIEYALPLWIVKQDNSVLNFTFEVEGVRQIQFDIVTDTCVYKIEYNPSVSQASMEDRILLLLKQYMYQVHFNKTIKCIGFINSATGVITEYAITPTIQKQLKTLWRYLQKKYDW
jgi:hypothetical protein